MTAAALAPIAYTVHQLAELLPISHKTIYRRIADGTIPTVRIGSKMWIPRSWVDEQFGGAA